MRPQSEEEYRDQLEEQALSQAEQEAIAAQGEYEQEKANRQSVSSNPIFVKRSVSEKLPEKQKDYFVFSRYKQFDITKACEYIPEDKGFFDYNQREHPDNNVTHWLEEVPLEEYLKELGLKAYVVQEMPARKQSRCCGRCDGVNDICVADTKCDPHKEYGCEICFGPRQINNNK